MTTVSVMAALLPIGSGLEEGSELLVSVAVVLIGGLLTSTLLTLVFVPAMYTIFDDMQAGVVGLARRLSRRRAPSAVPESRELAPVATSWVVPTGGGGNGHDGHTRVDGHGDERSKEPAPAHSDAWSESEPGAVGPGRR